MQLTLDTFYSSTFPPQLYDVQDVIVNQNPQLFASFCEFLRVICSCKHGPIPVCVGM